MFFFSRKICECPIHEYLYSKAVANLLCVSFFIFIEEAILCQNYRGHSEPSLVCFCTIKLTGIDRFNYEYLGGLINVSSERKS